MSTSPFDELGDLDFTDEAFCACGHHVEEHEPVGGGAGACEIEGCDCAHFEMSDEPPGGEG